MDKWTLIEAQSQHCTKSVVGSAKHYFPIDTLQHTWTDGDAAAGRCLPSEVGSSRLPPYASQVPPPDYEPPEPEIDLSQPGEGPNTDWIKAAFHGMGGKKAFVTYCKKNPALMWPQLVKSGLLQYLKEEPPAKKLGDYSSAELEALSSEDIKRLLLETKE